jgi:hypothetical protein
MGGIRITTEDVIRLVELRGGEFLGEETIATRRVVHIRCRLCGNEWKVLLQNLKAGDWCGVCRNIQHRVNRQKVIELVEAKGYKLLTNGELGLKTRFDIYCPIHDFEWESCYWNFKYYGESGGTCKLCASGSVSYEELKSFIESKNGTLVGRIHRGKHDSYSIMVRCNKHNKEFKTRWGNLQRGIWCRDCAIEERRITYNQIKELVESKNGTLLTAGCSTATMLFDVRCNVIGCGREWQTSYARIQSGCWCPKCAGFDRYTVEDVKELIDGRGELITTDIFNAHQKVDIKCCCGAKFAVNISDLARGVWCQVCQEGYKSQTELYKIVVSSFPATEVQYNQYPFDWLRSKSKLQIDIWIPTLKLAIEYDGIQHFRPTKFASTMTDEQANTALELTQAHDKIKDLLISQHPEDVKYFLRFKYDEPITREHVIERLKEKGIVV